jgi:hypothetical protein
MYQVLISSSLLVFFLPRYPFLCIFIYTQVEGLPRSRQATMTLHMSNLNNSLASLNLLTVRLLQSPTTISSKSFAYYGVCSVPYCKHLCRGLSRLAATTGGEKLNSIARDSTHFSTWLGLTALPVTTATSALH